MQCLQYLFYTFLSLKTQVILEGASKQSQVSPPPSKKFIAPGLFPMVLKFLDPPLSSSVCVFDILFRIMFFEWDVEKCTSQKRKKKDFPRFRRKVNSLVRGLSGKTQNLRTNCSLRGLSTPIKQC